MAKRRGRPPKVNPTLKEIEERCAEVQATWDEETRISRIADPSLLPYTFQTWHVPIIKTSGIGLELYYFDDLTEGCPFDEEE